MGASAIGLIEKDEGDLIDLTVQGHIFANDKGFSSYFASRNVLSGLDGAGSILKEKDKETSLNSIGVMLNEEVSLVIQNSNKKLKTPKGTVN